MSEHEHYDELITDAFDSFASAVAPSVRAAGTGAVRMTVNHRRKVRITTLSVLGALLFAVPVVAFAANPRGNNPPPGPATSATMEPTVEPSAEPSVTASAKPSTPPAPDGRITLPQLVAGPVEVPAWSRAFSNCGHGRIQLKADTLKESEVFVKKVVHTNLDGDEALETAAQLACRSGDPAPEQVVAYDRDANGHIVLLGRVYGQVDDVEYTRDMAARPDGGLKVTVCVGGCGSDPPANNYQDREYAWDGTTFARIK